MVDRRFRRRRSLRSILLFATGFCSLFVCFSWYTLMCCRTNMYGGYIINNFPVYPFREKGGGDRKQMDNADSSNPKDISVNTHEEIAGHNARVASTLNIYVQRHSSNYHVKSVGINRLEENSDSSVATGIQSQTPDERNVPFHSESESFSVKGHPLNEVYVAENKNVHSHHPYSEFQSEVALSKRAIGDDTARTISSSSVVDTSSMPNVFHSTVPETIHQHKPSRTMSGQYPISNHPRTLLPTKSINAEDVHSATFSEHLEHEKAFEEIVNHQIRKLGTEPLTNIPQTILPEQAFIAERAIQNNLGHPSSKFYAHPRTVTILPQSMPPMSEFDQYAVKAWLPRGIKERAESSSQESLSTTSVHPGIFSASQRMKRDVVLSDISRSSPSLGPDQGLGGQTKWQQKLRKHQVIEELGGQYSSGQSFKKELGNRISPHDRLRVVREHGGQNEPRLTLRQHQVIDELSGQIASIHSPRQNSVIRDVDSHLNKDTMVNGLGDPTESQLTLKHNLVIDGLADQSSSLGVGMGVQQQGLRRDVVVSDPVKRLPQALIIGVKKCGTRALLEFLRVHPDVRASGPETHFFDRHYERGLEWYRQQMPSTLSGQITMEKTPSYFITPSAPPRIRACLPPSTRLLVVVRDPVTRAVSDYTQSASKRPTAASFDEMAFLNASTGLVDTAWPAIRLGVYARFLEWWTPRYFPKSQILFISGEELVRDPASEMARVQDFLGLKRIVSDKHFYFNETKGFPCLKKSEGSGNPHCLGKTKGRAHPDISPATIQRLRDFYRPFNAKFYQMVGRNFGWP